MLDNEKMVGYIVRIKAIVRELRALMNLFLTLVGLASLLLASLRNIPF